MYDGNMRVGYRYTVYRFNRVLLLSSFLIFENITRVVVRINVTEHIRNFGHFPSCNLSCILFFSFFPFNVSLSESMSQ